MPWIGSWLTSAQIHLSEQALQIEDRNQIVGRVPNRQTTRLEGGFMLNDVAFVYVPHSSHGLDEETQWTPIQLEQSQIAVGLLRRDLEPMRYVDNC
jgi:hypothetical protein